MAGVRDYGNRMGIPTVAGSVWFHEGYVANPLVYAGTVGLMPRWAADKTVQPGDVIVTAGGRTGRDGIHGATFSSLELHEESETVSAGAVQIGDPITEKKVLDGLLAARDARLYRAVTDCGAGGLSSAVGEMGAECGATVDLEKVPLKYPGLSPEEIWISEAQERMVFAVPPEHLDALLATFEAEGAEATAIGTFTDSGRLVLRYDGVTQGDLDMHFLHEGNPRQTRQASLSPPEVEDPGAPGGGAGGPAARAARHPHHRQQGVDRASVRPRGAGAARDRPHERRRPRRAERRRGPEPAPGLAQGRRDRRRRERSLRPPRPARHGRGLHRRGPAQRGRRRSGSQPHLAARQLLLGQLQQARPTGCPRPRLQGLLRGRHGVRHAVHQRQGLAQQRVPRRGRDPGHPADAPDLGPRRGARRAALRDHGPEGGRRPRGADRHDPSGASAAPRLFAHLEARGRDRSAARPRDGRRLLARVHAAQQEGLLRTCHDLSEGGLGVALAESSMAGRLGARVSLAGVAEDATTALFSESTTRFLVEVRPADLDRLRAVLGEHPVHDLGEVTEAPLLEVSAPDGEPLVSLDVADLRAAFHGSFAG